MRSCWLGNGLLIALVLVLGWAIGCGGNAPPSGGGQQQLPFEDNAAIVIPANQTICIRLQQSISSATAEAGQDFLAVLDEPLKAEGQTLVPEGTPVSGRVLAARQSRRLHNTGYLRLTLSSITIHGKAVPLQTRSIFVEGRSFKDRNLAYIGGGVGGGAMLETLAGGGKGAVIGSGIENETTAAYVTDKNQVGFMAERRLVFRLAQPLSIH